MCFKIKYLILGFITLVINPSILFSSHLAGGKITYRYLGNNKYEYKLTVYRDCSDQVDFINPANIHIYNKSNNNLIINKNIILTRNQLLETSKTAKFWYFLSLFHGIKTVFKSGLKGII